MDKKTVGYTMAEVLLVLLIFSVMMLALPPMAKKMYKLDSVAKKHGRFECYYNQAGTLMQYRVIEGETPIIETATGGKCEFSPPSNSIYTMIHAVGGGGAGYNLNSSIGSPTEITATSYVSYSAVALWPEWFRFIMENRSKLGLAFPSDSYEIRKSFKNLAIPYGVSGNAGERVSMFFPRLRNVTIYATPGVGGQAAASGNGGNGTDTVVSFKYVGDSSATEVIRAAGGGGGTILGKYSAALAGGNTTDFGVGSFTAVKMKTSNFEDVLEESETKTKTHINDNSHWGGTNKAGWGGSGAYYYINSSSGSGKFWYLVNSFTAEEGSSIATARFDRWYVVTNKIQNYFYTRNGASGSCSLGSGAVTVDGMCKEYYAGGTMYNCYIGKPNDTSSMYPVTYNGSSFSGVPSGYSSCQFDSSKMKMVCTSGSLSNSTHTCTYNDSTFTCPNGNQNSSKNLCGARDGGNGAVVILW